MKEKPQETIMKDEYKTLVINETEFILQKMTESSTIDEKIYYFSGLQGVLNRVMNIEFTEGLLLAFFVTKEVHQAFHQKLISLKQGDAIKLSDQQVVRLIEITKEFLAATKNDDNIDEVLRKYVVLLYSTTGNGHYLMQKGMLKLQS